MPAYVIYILIGLAVGGAAGFGWYLGNATAAGFSIIGMGVVVFILWKPLIAPIIQKIIEK